MEDALEVYFRPFDPEIPLLCIAEFCKQLLSEPREPLPAKPDVNAKYDREHDGEGSASASMFSAPLLGQCEVFIGEKTRRTPEDVAHCLEYAASVIFPQAPRVVSCHQKLENFNFVVYCYDITYY